MKVKILIPFRDKETGKDYRTGEIVEMTADRFNEIRAYDRVVDAYEEVKRDGK